MRRTIVAFAGLVCIWSAALVWYVQAGGFAAAFLTCGFGALMAYGLLLPLIGLRRVEISRVIRPEAVIAGEPVTIELQLRLSSVLPLTWLVVRDNWMPGRPQAAPLTHTKLLCPWREKELRYAYTLMALPRGVYRAGLTEVTTGDPFGWITIRRTVRCDDRVVAYPRPAAVTDERPPAPAPYGVEPLGRTGLWRSSAGSGLRDYMPGDPLRLIHWKSTAKRGRLQTMQLEPAADRRRVIVMDASEPAGGSGRFEALVQTAAGLWLAASGEDGAAGFVCAGVPSLALRPGSRVAPAEWFGRLAELQPSSLQVLPDELARLHTGLPASVGLTIVTATLHADTVRTVQRLRGAKRHAALVHVTAGDSAGAVENRSYMELEAAGCSVAVVRLRGEGEVTAYAVDYAGA